jgi:hypothetical protein
MAEVNEVLEKLILQRARVAETADNDNDLSNALQDVIHLSQVYVSESKRLDEKLNKEAEQLNKTRTLDIESERISFEREKWNKEFEESKRARAEEEAIKKESLKIEREKLEYQDFERRLRENSLTLERERFEFESRNSTRDGHIRIAQIAGDILKVGITTGAGLVAISGVLDIEREGRVTSKLLNSIMGMIVKK